MFTGTPPNKPLVLKALAWGLFALNKRGELVRQLLTHRTCDRNRIVGYSATGLQKLLLLSDQIRLDAGCCRHRGIFFATIFYVKLSARLLSSFRFNFGNKKPCCGEASRVPKADCRTVP